MAAGECQEDQCVDTLLAVAATHEYEVHTLMAALFQTSSAMSAILWLFPRSSISYPAAPTQQRPARSLCLAEMQLKPDDAS